MTIGILGAGQLGRMLALAGYPLGLDFVFLDQSADAPGGQVGRIVSGAFDDRAQARASWPREVDVVTFDWRERAGRGGRGDRRAQTVPAAARERSARRRTGLHEKTLFRQLEIPTPRVRRGRFARELEAAVAKIGLPGVLKTRRLGYDGKGQFLLRKPADVGGAPGQRSAPCR